MAALQFLDWFTLVFFSAVACVERLFAIVEGKRRPSVEAFLVTLALLMLVLGLVPVR